MATGGNNKLNAIEMIKSSMEAKVKEVITERIVKEQLAIFEKDLRDRMKPMVNGLVFDLIENVQDFYNLRDELHVFITFNGDEEGKPIQETTKPPEGGPDA